jgi:hypothetical protein
LCRFGPLCALRLLRRFRLLLHTLLSLRRFRLLLRQFRPLLRWFRLLLLLLWLLLLLALSLCASRSNGSGEQ